MGNVAAPERLGSLDQALRHAAALADTRPALALEQAAEILRAVPGHPHAILIRGRAERISGDATAARATLSALAAAQPRAAAAHAELAHAHLACADLAAAEAAFRRAVALKPDLAPAWTGLAQSLRAQARDGEAEQAELAAIRAAAQDPELLEAALALLDNRLAVAEAILRTRLQRDPDDPPALRMLAEVAIRLGRLKDATAALQDCLDRSPAFDAARELLARTWHRMSRSAEALTETDRLLARDSANPSHRMLRAAILTRLGEQHAAIEAYRGVLAEHPRNPGGWMSLGHALKTVGQQAEAVAAYRRAILERPAMGEAWWSLANLKTVAFADADVAAMQSALATPDLSEDDSLHLHFALAKAMEDRADYPAAWGHCTAANVIRRDQLGYDPTETERAVTRAIATFKTANTRHLAGPKKRTPIFIVGLPRAGSTLIEQILSSHSQIEGTGELAELPIIAAQLAGKPGQDLYPESVLDLTDAEADALGAEYLSRAALHCKTDKPFFIDKLPNNWLHIGLLVRLLPNARIIDARRHPMAGCVAAYRQHFARGQAFSFDLAHLGHYYRQYVRAMAHYDRAYPAAIHRVIYEHVVADIETEVRAMLRYLDLDFEPACLNYYQSSRAVRTPSSEQVRQPIFTDGLDYWQNYNEYLEPLREALGSALLDWKILPQDLNEASAPRPLEG